MKLWNVPWPWDYHKQGGYVVMAKTKREAIAKVKKLHTDCKYCQCTSEKIKYEETEEVDDVYQESGCDC